MTRLARFPAIPVAFRYTQRDTHVVVGATGEVAEFDRSGKVIRGFRLGVPPGFLVSGLVIHGENRLQLDRDTTSTPDGIVFGLEDPAMAGKSYVLALSMDCKGFRVGRGLRINLALDPLFLLSARGALGPMGFTNNTGVLDGPGHARAILRRPKSMASLKGLTLYAAWVAYDRTGILSVSETEHFVLP